MRFRFARANHMIKPIMTLEHVFFINFRIRYTLLSSKFYNLANNF